MHTARKGINSNYIDFAATAEAIIISQVVTLFLILRS